MSRHCWAQLGKEPRRCMRNDSPQLGVDGAGQAREEQRKQPRRAPICWTLASLPRDGVAGVLWKCPSGALDICPWWPQTKP